jgi:hypothetical protein
MDDRQAKIQEITRLRKIQEIESLRSQQQAAPQPISDNIIEEMHPDFTTADRLLVKNFSNDGDSAARYLQKQHPNLEVKAQGDKILARGKGENAYKVLDPDTGFFSGDFLRDVGDVAYDIGSGVGSSAATAAGGLAGSLPGAAAAGAGAGAGLEALRQGIGRALGVNDEISGTDIALEGAFGAANPLLFGTGASAAQVGAKAAENFAQQGGEYLTKEAADKALIDATKKVADSQKGLIGRGLAYARDKITPALGELSSGIDSDVIRYARDNLDKFDEVDKSGAKNWIGPKRKEAVDLFKQAKENVGSQIGDAVKGSSAPVDLSAGMQRFKDHYDELKSLNQTPAVKEEIDALKATFGHVFGQDIDSEALSTVVDPHNAWRAVKALGDEGSIKSGVRGSLESGLEKQTTANKNVMGLARTAAGDISESLGASVPELDGLNSKYKELIDLQQSLKSYFKSDKSAWKSLFSMGSPQKRVDLEDLARLDQLTGSNAVDTSKFVTAYRNFSNAPWLAKSAGGTTSTSRTVPAALAGAGLGYWAGANSGVGQGGAGVGAALGGALGATVGGPKALRAYMKMGNAGGKLADVLRSAPGRPLQSAPASVWNAVMDRKRQEADGK